MTILERLESIDRRIIYVVMGAAVLIPILFPLNLGVTVTPAVQSAYDAIEKVEPGARVLVSFDYGPSSAPENDPMAAAILRHCIARGVRPVVIALYPVGGGTMALRQVEHLAKEFPDKQPGVDYVNLGYKDGGQAAMKQMGENLPVVFPADAGGKKIGEIPLMQGVKGYKDFELGVTLPTGIIGEYWVNLVNAQYKLPLVIGPTAVAAPKFFAYLKAGQAVGLIGGLKGASEYEKLLVAGHPELASLYKGSGAYTATKGMDAQQTAHLAVVFFILMGNTFYLIGRRQQRAAGAEVR